MRGRITNDIFVPWLIASAMLGTIIGFSEKFGYDLRGCQPEMAPWFRYGFLQYALIIFAISCWEVVPGRYLRAVDHFISNRELTFTLGLIFIVEQVLTPWITLILYVKLRNVCKDRITTGQGIFYWVMFSLQVLVFLIACTLLYYIGNIFIDRAFGPSAERKRKQQYDSQARNILLTSRNPRTPYAELLKGSGSSYLYSLLRVDFQLFHVTLGSKIDSRCYEILKTQHRVCFRCKSGFEQGDRVHFTEQCLHLAHWECFISAIAYTGVCSECKLSIVAGLKRSIMAGPPKDLEPLITVMPKLPPSCKEQTKRPPVVDNTTANRILSIEYFNYTVDQKTGGEPAEALPAPVAETEI